MGVIVLKEEWRRQPPQGQSLRVDWSNPLTRGLVSLIPLNGVVAFDYVRNIQGTPTGNNETVANKHGLFPLFGNGVARYFTFAPLASGLIKADGPVSVGWTQEIRGLSAYSTPFDFSPTPGAHRICAYQAASGYSFVVGWRGASGQRNYGASIGARPANVAEAFVWTSKSYSSLTSTDHVVYRDQNPAAACDGTISFTGNTTPGFVIGAVNVSSDPFDGLLGNLAIWNRELSASEAWSYNENPYHLYL